MISELCKALAFPDEACDTLSACHAAVMADPTARAIIDRVREKLFSSDPFDGTQLSEVSERLGIDVMVVHMVFLLHCAPDMRARYREMGLDDALFWDTLQDLRYQVMETKQVYGVWGEHAIWWEVDFFRCKRFALGRLQYEWDGYYCDTPYKQYQKGDRILSCHIPSSGKLRREDVLLSLKKAYEFYDGRSCEGGIMAVQCESWMLYDKHLPLFPKGSNLRMFYLLFHNIENKPSKSNIDFWRIFGTKYSPEALESASESTALQRNFKHFLREGNTMGFGKSVLLFDGERILTEQVED